MAPVYKCVRCGAKNEYKHGKPKYCRACRRIVECERGKKYWARQKEKAAVVNILKHKAQRRSSVLAKYRVPAKCPICHKIHVVVQTIKPRPNEPMPWVYCDEHVARRHYSEVYA